MPSTTRRPIAPDRRGRPTGLLALAVIVGIGALSAGGALFAGLRSSGSATGATGSAMAMTSAEHIHGLAIDSDDSVFVATHGGLFRRQPGGAPTRVGPVIDLMGFTAVGPGHFYASGHPGPGVDLPNPVGLLETRDAGKTWTQLSRQGQSDFHTLTSSGNGGVLGFDGALRASGDARTWTEGQIPAPPFALSAQPHGDTVLATTESGLLRSGDSGATWQPVANAPLLMLAAWADADTAVGVAPDGTVAVSSDAGSTWETRGKVTGSPQALTATGDDAHLRVIIATEGTLIESNDGGRTFRQL